MVKTALQTAGWTLARLPESVLRGVAWSLGRAIYYGYGSRRRLIRSNLHHAFPEKPAAWHRATARECMRGLVESALLSIDKTLLTTERLRRIVSAAASIVAF